MKFLLILGRKTIIIDFCVKRNQRFLRITVRGGASMPNIKSAKKRVSLSRAANEKNKMEKSELKTTNKKFDAPLAAAAKTQANAAFTAAVVAVDKAVNKGILHKNNAARKKSSMALKINAMA